MLAMLCRKKQGKCFIFSGKRAVGGLAGKGADCVVTWLARDKARLTFFAKPFAKAFDLRGFSAAVKAFDYYEHAKPPKKEALSA
jgi:hypothetical protein